MRSLLSKGTEISTTRSAAQQFNCLVVWSCALGIDFIGQENTSSRAHVSRWISLLERSQPFSTRTIFLPVLSFIFDHPLAIDAAILMVIIPVRPGSNCCSRLRDLW